MNAPFPWFGGKSRASSLIWSRLGAADLGNYAEPFFGSGAVWLNRPAEFAGWAVVNDLDGNIANVWRSMQYSPDAVADAACWPVNEADLHARHLWLVNNVRGLSDRLMADPDYHEPRTAGWWIWGACSWIGSGWCAGDGPWHAEMDEEGLATFTLGDGGRGVNRQLPHLGDGGKGVNRQLPHLGNGGKGVNRKRPHLGNGGKGDRLAWLQEWFAGLQSKLDGVRVCCGDWSRILSPGTLTRNGVCGVLLDPPYSLTEPVYAMDGREISVSAREWCLLNGADPKMRIALCGHDGEHNELEEWGWSVATWGKAGGYQGKDERERIWFSPYSLGGSDPAQTDLFGAI